MEVAWGERDGHAVLFVTGVDDDGPSRRASPRVYPASAVSAPVDAPTRPSMAGRWERSPGPPGTWVFVPRFPFLPSTSYLVVSSPGPDQGSVSTRITSPPIEGAATTLVTGIDPGGATVPRNLLRLYVSFSTPMAEGHAARRVRIERASTGRPLSDVLLPLEPELWDSARCRLTVLLDPARIKRGLRPHEEAGYPLTEGDHIRVVVDPAYPDAEGRPLLEGFDRVYGVGPDLRGRIDPSTWEVSSPGAGSLDPLTIEFGRPLDRPLAARCVQVVGLAGVGSVSADGTAWRFAPAHPWNGGPVEVDVDPILEDVAGNSVLRVFDRDLRRPEDDPVDRRSVRGVACMIGPPDQR